MHPDVYIIMVLVVAMTLNMYTKLMWHALSYLGSSIGTLELTAAVISMTYDKFIYTSVLCLVGINWSYMVWPSLVWCDVAYWCGIHWSGVMLPTGVA